MSYFFWLGSEGEPEPLHIPVDTWQIDLTDGQTDE